MIPGRIRKIIHVTVGKVNPNGSNGINRVVYNLNKEEKRAGIDSEIWSFSSEVSCETLFVRDEFVEVSLFPFIMPWRRQIIGRLKSTDLSDCIFHFHTPWIKEKAIMTAILRKLEVPYVVSLHGLYYRGFLKRPKKYFAFHLYEKSVLNKSAGIRAITYEEKRNARQIGLSCPIFVSPNGVEPSKYHMPSPHNPVCGANERVEICWVGVLRDYKNIDKLILSAKHFSPALRNLIRFKIVGPDHDGNLKKYQALSSKLGVSECFEFTGALFGEDKFHAIQMADLYVMPSEIDEISLAVLDAMISAKPIIATRQCHLTYYFRSDFFEMCEPYPEDIAAAISRMIERRGDWEKMGQNALRLAETEFSWAHISREITRFYSFAAEGVEDFNSTNESALGPAHAAGLEKPT